MCNLKLRWLTTPTDDLQNEYHFENREKYLVNCNFYKSCEVWDEEYFAWNVQDFFLDWKRLLSNITSSEVCQFYFWFWIRSNEAKKLILIFVFMFLAISKRSYWYVKL